MKKLMNFAGMLLLAIVGVLVNAWGYQVFWNHIVLNVWELFTGTDVYSKLHLSYGVFLAITVGKSLLWKPKGEESTQELSKAVEMVLPAMISKTITIVLTLLLALVVF